MEQPLMAAPTLLVQSLSLHPAVALGRNRSYTASQLSALGMGLDRTGQWPSIARAICLAQRSPAGRLTMEPSSNSCRAHITLGQKKWCIASPTETATSHLAEESLSMAPAMF